VSERNPESFEEAMNILYQERIIFDEIERKKNQSDRIRESSAVEKVRREVRNENIQRKYQKKNECAEEFRCGNCKKAGHS